MDRKISVQEEDVQGGGGRCLVITEMMLGYRLIVCNLDLKISFEDLYQSGRLFQSSVVM